MRLLLDDGALELRVEGSDGTSIDTTVVVGGMLAQHKGINAPDVELPASALTEKDVADLRFGASIGVDMVALSFVQTVDDLRRTREALREAGAEKTSLIAKIERPQAVKNLHALLGACDGVMVARGDLGNEVPLHSVPRAQKVITQLAQEAGMPVIVATQVLESMRTNPRPTRAEVSDAANAVDDSVDAVMLSGETASGLYPVEAVTVLDAVIRDAEGLPVKPRAPFNAGVLGVPHNRALCEAAVTLRTPAKRRGDRRRHATGQDRARVVGAAPRVADLRRHVRRARGSAPDAASRGGADRPGAGPPGQPWRHRGRALPRRAGHPAPRGADCVREHQRRPHAHGRQFPPYSERRLTMREREKEISPCLRASLQASQPLRPPRAHDPVVPLPPRAVVTAGLVHPEAGAGECQVEGDVQGHRADGVALGRHPVGVGEEELAAGRTSMTIP